MTYRTFHVGAAIGVVALLALTGCAGPNSTEKSTPENTAAEKPAAAETGSSLEQVPSFELTSESVTEGEEFPLAQRSGLFGVPGGEDISPQLSWSGFPEETESFLVSVYDPDAPTGSGFWHWTVANIPADVTSLPENAGAASGAGLPAGAVQVPNDAGVAQYIGAAPPSGTHDYEISVTALSVPAFGPEQLATSPLAQFYASSEVLARATITVPATAGEGD